MARGWPPPTRSQKQPAHPPCWHHDNEGQRGQEPDGLAELTQRPVSHDRDNGDRVFETYWTHGRGVEAMDYRYALMDLTVSGRQETWEDSPDGWPRREEWNYRTNGRPIAQWSRIQAGRSDDLGTTVA